MSTSRSESSSDASRLSSPWWGAGRSTRTLTSWVENPGAGTGAGLLPQRVSSASQPVARCLRASGLRLYISMGFASQMAVRSTVIPSFSAIRLDAMFCSLIIETIR